MSLKKNFYQALGELLSGENPTGNQPDTERAAQDSPAAPAGEAPAQAAPASQSAEESFDAVFERQAGASAGPSGAGWSNPFRRPGPEERPEGGFTPPPERPLPSNEMTLISKNTVILGDIRTLANITIEGNVRGRVEVLRDATVQGMVVGDLSGKNVRLQSSAVQGDILSRESMQVDHSSTVLGNLSAQFASIDGKVKGNIQTNGKVEFLENAIIAGDIYTSSISVADGANIKGFVTTAYLGEHADNAFPSQFVINEDELADYIK